MTRLAQAVDEGDQVLSEAWELPGSARALHHAKEVELRQLLDDLVTREAASDMLYVHCFPDRALIERFEQTCQANRAAVDG